MKGFGVSLKTISTRLTAFFNPDGQHLQRYLDRAPTIKKSLCEDLILHDQVLVPTQDFLTACGLILILGENGFNELLERDRLKFIRIRRGFGFVRGNGPDGGLVVFGDSENRIPFSAPLEQSVEAGLAVIQDRIQDRKKLHRNILEHTLALDAEEILNAVRQEAIRDLKYTVLWKPEYEVESPDLLALPGVEELQVRVIGPGHDPKKNVVDTLLALVLYNSEFYLAQKFEAQNSSPFFPIGDLLNIKGQRLANHLGRSVNLWTLLEVNGVPDFSKVEFNQDSAFNDLLQILSNKRAHNFREWFQEKADLNEKELIAEYIALLKQVPWIERLPAKIIRFAITTGTGFVNVPLGHALSVFDNFIVGRLFRQQSPRFFIDDLTRLTGDLLLDGK
jgi:hypothetical protein